MRIAISTLLAIVGLIHLLPLSGLLGAQRLAALYGLPFDDPNLLLLMRHRAVLFGLLGGLLLYAALRPAWTGAALVAGFLSVASFLLLAMAAPALNPGVARVVTADWIALACLAAAAVLWWWSPRQA